MSEIRQLNDARRKRFCHPGAEGDEFVICDLGTPWCPIDHDEALESDMLEAIADGVSEPLGALLYELKQRACTAHTIKREPSHWVVFYRDRWGAEGMRGLILPLASPPSKSRGVTLADVTNAAKSQTQREINIPPAPMPLAMIWAVSGLVAMIGMALLVAVSLLWP